MTLLAFLTFKMMCMLIVVGISGVEGKAQRKLIPSFTMQELRNNHRYEELKAILTTTGLLSIEASSFNDAFRHAALDGLCRCEEQLLTIENTDSATLQDGSTVRTTLATATVGTTPRSLPTSLGENCGDDMVLSMEHLRDEVAGAADVFIQALDSLIGTDDTNMPLMRDSNGHSYGRVASIVSAANHLEHFHVYSKKIETATMALDWHTDAGLFLAFVPALDCHGSIANEDNSFWYQDENGVGKIAQFQPNTIVIMMGAGAENWLHSSVPIRATRHAVSMNAGQERAWYGMMQLVPENAIIQESPQKTFSDMKKALTLTSDRVYGDDDGADSISIGCGSTATTMVPIFSRIPLPTVSSRRRLQHVGSPSECNNSTNFFCWMSCLDIPSIDRAESYVKSGHSLYCLDPSVLASSGQDVSLAVSECPYGVHNARCLGSWQFTVPGVPSTTVVYNATDTADEPFCYGGTSMFMDGFHWTDTVCIIYLFPSWILNTKAKFIAASIGSLFVGVLLEGIIMRRRMAMSSMGPGSRRLLASAWFYGLQLTIGYFGMLVVMTYSGPLFMCIVLGIIGGHVLFNAKDAVYIAKETSTKTVLTNGDVGEEVRQRSCCPRNQPQMADSSHTNSAAWEDDNNGVPEGSTPCCQHTL